MTKQIKPKKSELDRWDLDGLQDWVSKLKSVNDGFLDNITSSRNYFTEVASGWQGAAYNAAYERVAEDFEQSRRVFYEVEDVPIGAQSSVTNLWLLRRAALDKYSDATLAGYGVSDDWIVSGNDKGSISKTDFQNALNLAMDALSLEILNLQGILASNSLRIRAAGDLLGSGNFIDEQSTVARSNSLAQGFHDDLLARYNVTVDPEGMTTWPKPPLSWMFGAMPMTTGESRLLTDIGLDGARDAYGVCKTAVHESENVFEGQGLTDGHSDAFRHAYWNAMTGCRPRGIICSHQRCGAERSDGRCRFEWPAGPERYSQSRTDRSRNRSPRYRRHQSGRSRNRLRAGWLQSGKRR
ncbi:DUF6973 domain-containing protein [Nocardia asteroides]|uniref:DUF6973 domain-containing protein n=1 Tax=Nocardia asteroides TaxID=1824 RepID=UPI0037CA43AF